MTKLTTERREVFLRAIVAGNSVTLAAQHVGATRDAIYKLRDRDPAFRAAWREADETKVELLEAALHQRGRRDDTTAAIFMLKMLKPETYNPLLLLRMELLRLEIRRAELQVQAAQRAPLIDGKVEEPVKSEDELRAELEIILAQIGMADRLNGKVH